MSINLYPVKTTVDGRIVRNLRLRVDWTGTVVWRMGPDGQVEELLRSSRPAERVGASQSWRVEDQVFEPQRGCGCNHPMYRWVPPPEGDA